MLLLPNYWSPHLLLFHIRRIPASRLHGRGNSAKSEVGGQQHPLGLSLITSTFIISTDSTSASFWLKGNFGDNISIIDSLEFSFTAIKFLFLSGWGDVPTDYLEGIFIGYFNMSVYFKRYLLAHPLERTVVANDFERLLWRLVRVFSQRVGQLYGLHLGNKINYALMIGQRQRIILKTKDR